MAISSKDIETLWKLYSSEAVNRGVSVAQFFESNDFGADCKGHGREMRGTSYGENELLRCVDKIMMTDAWLLTLAAEG